MCSGKISIYRSCSQLVRSSIKLYNIESNQHLQPTGRNQREELEIQQLHAGKNTVISRKPFDYLFVYLVCI